jgi:hypothetical protein
MADARLRGELTGRPLCGQASAVRIRGKVLAQPLCARLANMERCTDGTYRGKAISCELGREHHCGPLSERIDNGHIILRPGRHDRHLGAANDHHQELIRSDKRDRRPSCHSGADDAVAQAVGDVRGECRDDAHAKEPPRQRRHPDTPPRRVQHHHRTGVDQPVHRQGDRGVLSSRTRRAPAPDRSRARMTRPQRRQAQPAPLTT